MALHEQTVISLIAILEDGQLQIRRSRRIFDNATAIAEQYHRHVEDPSDPTMTPETAAFLQRHFRITATSCEWTPETRAARHAFIAANAATSR